MFSLRKNLKESDYALWVIILILCLVSLSVVYSATVTLAQRQEHTNIFYLLMQLGSFAVGGIFMCFLIASINPHGLIRYSRMFLYIALFMSFLVFTGIGVEKNEARRWINLGVPINPFDFLRVAIILDLGYQLTIKRDIIYKIRIVPNIFKWDRESRRKNWLILKKTTFGMLAPSIIAVGLVFKENISTAVIMGIMICVMLFLGNVRGKELISVIFVYAPLFIVLLGGIYYVTDSGRVGTLFNRTGFSSESQSQVVTEYDSNPSVPERKEEIYRILKSNDKNNSDYQKTYARIAMSSGGFFGKGPGNSTLRSKLPNSYDDFVYAIIVEEYGAVGGIFVLLLYVALLFRGIKIALRCKYYSLRLVSLGLVIHITFTAFIHMLVATGNVITTGQTLPLISKGASSILANSIALGILLSISSRKVKKDKVLEQIEQKDDEELENNN